MEKSISRRTRNGPNSADRLSLSEKYDCPCPSGTESKIDTRPIKEWTVIDLIGHNALDGNNDYLSADAG